MKTAALDVLVCPSCKEQLSLRTRCGRRGDSRGEPRRASLWDELPDSRRRSTIRARGGYASSFGSQWNWFRAVQLDSLNTTAESEGRTAGDNRMADAGIEGRLLLDAGVGAGRFAEQAAAKGRRCSAST